MATQHQDDTAVLRMESQKHIAIIAHDNRKADLVQWAVDNRVELARHFLCGTGTTAKVIARAAGLPITALHSGPMGGDQQVGARIAEGKIDFMLFFWDPLAAQPHDPDVKALLRIAVLYNIPVAMNRSTADFLLSSPLMRGEYDRQVVDYAARLRRRTKEFAHGEE